MLAGRSVGGEGADSEAHEGNVSPLQWAGVGFEYLADGPVRIVVGERSGRVLPVLETVNRVAVLEAIEPVVVVSADRVDAEEGPLDFDDLRVGGDLHEGCGEH